MDGLQSGYQIGSAPTAGSSAPAGPDDPSDLADHAALRRHYLAYLGNKSEEIKEQQEARRYYHGAQWSEKAVKEFRRRKQPVVTYNRIARKLNAVVGLLERQRQDPRGFPRTPNQEDGAEIATAVLRYVLDAQDWKAKSPVAGMSGAVDGIGGIELILEGGDQGDVDVGFETVDPSAFFYDPRSLKMDFSDARYMGIGKWADIDAAVEMFPDKAVEIRESAEAGSELTSNPASDDKWIFGNAGDRRIRIIDHWYIKNGDWFYCVYTGATKLAEGKSYLVDEKGKTVCKYIMYSANVDQDGDRYGFVRNMKSAQDEINQRRSKGLHIHNSRRMTIVKGQVDDIEKARHEAARPDGVIVLNPVGGGGAGSPPLFDDAAKSAELQGQLAFLQDAKDEIENYGFNPALMGGSAGVASGRALQIQQQSGIAELGPYLLGYKGWKLRLYRAIWNAAQQHWTAQRWIRVTDDQGLAQFLAINQAQIDPATGQQTMVNALGSLDVDIIIDEGPDEINMQADAYDTMTAMAQKGQAVPPQVIIELSPLTGSVKKKIIGMLEQAQQGPAAQAAMQTKLSEAQAVAENRVAQAGLFKAQTEQILGTIPGQVQKTRADTAKTIAEAAKSQSQAGEADARAGAAHAKTLESFTKAHVNAKAVMTPDPAPVQPPAAVAPVQPQDPTIL